MDGTWNVPTTLTFVGSVHPDGHTSRFGAVLGWAQFDKGRTSFLFALDLRRLSYENGLEVHWLQNLWCSTGFNLRDNLTFASKNTLSNSPNPLENAALDPDVALMLRVRDDDAVAFEMLVDRHQGKIQRFMQGWVNNVQQSEDLAQDVFLRVYKARKTYMPTAKFTTWLYRIANNIASNHIRDNANRREYQLSRNENTTSTGVIIENIAIAPSGFQPSRSLEHAERSSIILQGLQALGERQRTALMLSKFEGMSYQEISETMGLSVQAIKSLLSRARISLKNLLDPYLAEGLLPGSSKPGEVPETDKPGSRNSIHKGEKE